MQTAFQKRKPRSQKKNDPVAPVNAEKPVAEEEPVTEVASIEETDVTPVTFEAPNNDTALEDEFLGGNVDVSAPEQPTSTATHSTEPAKVYSAAEREALAKKMLPSDVVEYLKEEFRAEFTNVRRLNDRKLY